MTSIGPVRAGVAAIITGLLVVGPGCSSIGTDRAYAQAPAEPQKAIVHLGSFTDDLHSAFMALSLGTNMVKSGAKVTLFLDREGVRLADSKERGDLKWGDSGPVSAAFSEFVAAGGEVVVCPHCAMLAGVEEANLRAGARMGTPDSIAALFLAADKVVDF
ncbi:signal peptide-domain containing protein [bacterium]|nr:signal peptide-domain containing protein [bacterium]